MNETTSLLNPNLDTSALLSKIIFVGSYINEFLVEGISKIVPLNQTQISILIVLIYMGLLYLVINVIEIAKKPLKICIIIGIIILVFGFFKPV